VVPETSSFLILPLKVLRGQRSCRELPLRAVRFKHVSKCDYNQGTERSREVHAGSPVKDSKRTHTQWEPIWRPATWYITTILTCLRWMREGGVMTWFENQLDVCCCRSFDYDGELPKY
jgi:hypothetical protein